MNPFVFIIKDNNQKAFDSFFWFLYFLHLTAASVIIVNAEAAFYKKAALTIFVLMVVVTAIFYLLKNKTRRYRYQLLLFGIMALLWLLLSAWLVFIAVTAIIIFAVLVLKIKNTVIVTAENIVIKRSLFKKVYAWAIIENVVLKDNLLSVDLKNNHLIQLELAAESHATNETLFNQFCHQQLLNLQPSTFNL